MGLVLLAMLLIFAGAWVLGALANHRPRPRPRPLPGTFDYPDDNEPSGFSAWTEPPAGGLRPPAIVRWVVGVLSAGARLPGLNLICFGLGLAGIGLVAALAYKPDAFWATLHPDLADASARNILWLGGAAAVLLMLLRMWATEQRDRLEPTADPQPVGPGWGYAFLAMLLLGGGAFAVMMGLPLWLVIAVALVLCVIAVVGRWRESTLDWTFGKRAEQRPPRVAGPPRP